jgi:hypothetical protein
LTNGERMAPTGIKAESFKKSRLLKECICVTS